MEHLLEVSNVDIFHGDAQAIWEVSFYVAQEQIVALVGANGAVKSTLLEAVSCMIRPKKGELFFKGKSIGNVKPEAVADLGISHVPEGRGLFSRMTVLENLELGGFPKRTRPFSKNLWSGFLVCFHCLKNAFISRRDRSVAVSSRCWPLGALLWQNPIFSC